MNLTLALLAVTAAIPVSLQPHSVKFYSFLVVAARPQPYRGGWRGESPALRNSRPGRRSREPWPGGMCQGAAWSILGSSRQECSVQRVVQSCMWDEVHHRSHPIPVWIWASPARVPWVGGGKMPGEWAELLASEPCWA